MKKKILLITFSFFIALLVYSSEIQNNNNSVLVLSNTSVNSNIGEYSAYIGMSLGINSTEINKNIYFKSKGISRIFKRSDGSRYAVILNDDKANIVKIENGGILSFSVVNDFVGKVTIRGTEYSGIGASVTDGEYIYMAYSSDAASQSQALKIIKADYSGNIIWSRAYDNNGSKYVALDADIKGDNVYVLITDFQISETSKPVQKILKVSSNGALNTFIADIQEVTKGKNNDQRGYVNNLTVSKSQDVISLFGVYPAAYSSFLSMISVSFNNEGVKIKQETNNINEVDGTAFSSVSQDGDLYVLYGRHSGKRKIIKLNSNLSIVWHTNINDVMPHSLYVDSQGIHIGCSNGSDIYYRIYDRSNGKLLRTRILKTTSTISQLLSIYPMDASNIGILTSQNGGVCYSNIPISDKNIHVYYSGNTNFENSVISPDFTTSQQIEVEYQIQYRNIAANAAPDIGYPKVVIYSRVGDNVTSRNVIMTAMDASDSNYTDGKIYSCKEPLIFLGGFKYSYKIEVKSGNETFSSDIIDGPFYGNDPYFVADGNSYVYPGRLYENTHIYINAKFIDPMNSGLKSGHPHITIINTSNNAVVINKAAMNAANENSVHEYKVGQLPEGNYKYTIKGENIINLSAETEGFFTVEKNISGLSNSRSFNAPNPFKAGREDTRIVFYAQKAENVKITIYSLYGDKVFEDNFPSIAGTNEYVYRGKDNSGNVLYNGVYIVEIDKSGGKSKFKMLVVK